jgi:uncharacterized Zn finger protein (UPF0148 family)
MCPECGTVLVARTVVCPDCGFDPTVPDPAQEADLLGPGPIAAGS